VSKALVENVGAFEYLIPESGEYIRFQGATVVRMTGFISSKIATGQVRLVGALTKDATDDEYIKYIRDSGGNHALASASFLSKYGVSAEPVPIPAPPPAPKIAPKRRVK
jgi:hypothetical protein